MNPRKISAVPNFEKFDVVNLNTEQMRSLQEEKLALQQLSMQHKNW